MGIEPWFFYANVQILAITQLSKWINLFYSLKMSFSPYYTYSCHLENVRYLKRKEVFEWLIKRVWRCHIFYRHFNLQASGSVSLATKRESGCTYRYLFVLCFVEQKAYYVKRGGLTKHWKIEIIARDHPGNGNNKDDMIIVMNSL